MIPPRSVLGLGVMLLLATHVDAQTPPPDTIRVRTAGEWAWRPILDQDSVQVRYLFYSEADNQNNGVVFRLDNASSVAVTYRFTALFRSGEDRAEASVAGRVGAGRTITGDSDGLFFIPFPDGREVTEIGIRGFRVRRMPPDS